MESQTPQQGFGKSDHGSARPPYARSHSQGFETNIGNGTRDAMYSIPEANGQSSHLEAGRYTNHVRSSSRTSWDGVRVPLPASHTPPQSPPQSPRLRSHRPRPLSVTSLPDYTLGRPIGLPDRWSYDRERMPSPPPAARSSRPGTPSSDWEALDAAFSRPGSTLNESRSSSRPPSILLSASTELGGHSHTASTPTLRLHPPPFGDTAHPQQQQQQQQQHPNHRQSYHLLTPEELELLAHPPPLQPPMTASPQSPRSPRHSPSHTPSPDSGTTTTPKHTTPTTTNDNTTTEDDDDLPQKTSRCTNLCELTPGRQVCGTFGAWLVGMALPITFGAVTGCLLGVCR